MRNGWLVVVFTLVCGAAAAQSARDPAIQELERDIKGRPAISVL